MNEQEIRDALAAALAETWRAGPGFIVQPSGPPRTDWGVFADALMPVVRRIVAAELRAAAGGDDCPVTDRLYNRADELDGG